MSGTTTTPSPAEVPETKQWDASLVRGRFFATPNYVWDADDPKFRETAIPVVTVDTQTKEYLERTAIDSVPVGGEGRYLDFPKFTFEVHAPKAPERSRNRA